MRILSSLALTTLAISSLAAQAAPENLIQNGGFEASAAGTQSPDAITAWTSAEQGILGGVMVLDGFESLASGMATVGAAAGKNYALLDTMGNANLALSQRVHIGQALQSATLSFAWFANYSGQLSTPVGSSLDHTSAGSFDANVQIRVDILRTGADDFSTDAADLIWSGAADTLSAGPNTYTQATVGLNAALFKAGQDYTIRFAAVSNDGGLVAGLDDVAFNVVAVPEPESWALMAAGLGLLMARRRSTTRR